MTWLIGIVGIVGEILATVLSFFPPSQINTGSPVTYIAILVVGCSVLLAVPFIVYDRRKASWRDKNTDFYPFYWEIEGRRPDVVSKWPEGYEPTEAQIARAMEWQDGDFGPVSMKTIGDIDNLALQPNLANGIPSVGATATATAAPPTASTTDSALNADAEKLEQDTQKLREDIQLLDEAQASEKLDDAAKGNE